MLGQRTRPASQRAGDEDLAVYADEKQAVLLTHDREFSKRRRAWIIAKHIWLKCPELDAADLLARLFQSYYRSSRASRTCSSRWRRTATRST
jgi:predicted nuclease of predicted toxin-antitoxin system